MGFGNLKPLVKHPIEGFLETPSSLIGKDLLLGLSERRPERATARLAASHGLRSHRRPGPKATLRMGSIMSFPSLSLPKNV